MTEQASALSLQDDHVASRQASSFAAAPERMRLYSLEIGRGIAASLVVFHHAGNIMAEPRFFGAHPFDGLFKNFNVGVDFFFVLSGFIITWIHSSDIGQPKSVWRFAERRFTRIYPGYWGILIPLILLYLLMPSAGKASQHDFMTALTSFFLLPWFNQPVLGVAWTLVREIMFYGLFAAAILGGRRAVVIFPLWAAAIVIFNVAWPAAADNVFFDAFNVEFVLGMGVAWILKRGRVAYPAWLFTAGAITFLVAMVCFRTLQDVPIVARGVYGLSSAAMILGMVELERGYGFSAPSWIKVFGAASYAIYLIHPVALSFLINIWVKFLGRGYPMIASLVVACCALACGIAYHFLGERPLTQLVRDLMRGGRR